MAPAASNPYSSVARAPSLSDKVAEQLTDAITSRGCRPESSCPPSAIWARNSKSPAP